MPSHDPSHPDSMARRIARDWVLRLASADVDEHALVELRQWRQSRPGNNKAFEVERRLYRSLQPLDAAFAGITKPGAAKTSAPRAWGRMRAVAGMGVAFVAFWLAFDPLVGMRADKMAAIGEISHLRLPDGSRAILDSGSALAIDFGAAQRRVHLLRGEAWFQVVHDAKHPFIVEANGATARAVGTAFALRREGSGQTRLVVTEGRVRYSGGSPIESIDVSAGQAAETTDRNPGPRAVKADIKAALAWRSGQIVFYDRSLSDLAHDLGRYHRGVIWVTGSAATRRVSGVLEVQAIDKGLNGLAAAQGLRIRHLTPWITILS